MVKKKTRAKCPTGFEADELGCCSPKKNKPSEGKVVHTTSWDGIHKFLNYIEANFTRVLEKDEIDDFGKAINFINDKYGTSYTKNIWSEIGEKEFSFLTHKKYMKKQKPTPKPTVDVTYVCKSGTRTDRTRCKVQFCTPNQDLLDKWVGSGQTSRIVF